MLKKILVLCLLLGLIGVIFAERKVSIVTYFDVNPDATWPAALGIWKVAEKFMQQRPDIKLEFVFIPFGELVPQVMRWAMIGEGPDVIGLDNPDVLHAAAAGVYMDLTPRVKAWGQWEDFYLGYRVATTYKDKVYAIQFGTNNLALFYNKDIFDKYGLKPPKTWAELLDVCEKLKKYLEGTGMYPIGIAAVNTEELTFQFLPFLWSNNATLLELDTPQAVEALKLWVTLLEKGYAPKDVLTWGQGADPLIGKQVAMMVNGPWIIPLLQQAGLNFGVAPLPAPKEGMPVIVPTGGETFGINVACKDPDAAWEFIKFFVEPENMAYFCSISYYVPCRASATKLVIEKQPILKVFAEQAIRALPRPQMGGEEHYTEVSAIARQYVQLALTKELSPEEAFKRAAEEIRNVFPTKQAFEEAKKKARQLLDQARK